MEVKIVDESPFHIISIIGDLDASSAIVLDNAVEQAIGQSKKNILVDCTQLNYISSPGIGVFTSRLDECENKQIYLALFGMNDKIRNVFEILGLDQILTIKKNKEEAKTYSL